MAILDPRSRPKFFHFMTFLPYLRVLYPKKSVKLDFLFFSRFLEISKTTFFGKHKIGQNPIFGTLNFDQIFQISAKRRYSCYEYLIFNAKTGFGILVGMAKSRKLTILGFPKIDQNGNFGPPIETEIFPFYDFFAIFKGFLPQKIGQT